jgi:lipopolysaccharide biosynthesis glycosyltransferase
MTIPKLVDVALCFDDRLALPGAVAILSALAANRDHVRVNVVTEASAPARDLLRAIAAQSGAELRLIEETPETRRGFDATSDYGTASTATYRRIFLPELLPDLDRVLYLDADTLVRHDLRPLWETDLAGAPLAAVADPWMETVEAMRAEFPHGYFNAGVQLLDLARWRREDLTARCVEEIERCAALAAASGGNALHYRNEQTPLNAVVKGRWRKLSPTWNCTPLLTTDLAAAIGVPAPECAAILADPAIVHFLGAHKPWLPGFERLSAFHAEFDRWHRRLEADFEVSALAWPQPFTNGPDAAVRRRALALQLVAEARRIGMSSPAVVLTGLLGRDVLEVAREQGLNVAGFVTEYPMFAGHSLLGLPIVSVGEAIRAGQRDFIVGDYRRLARTRAFLARETAGCEGLRFVDVAARAETRQSSRNMTSAST